MTDTEEVEDQEQDQEQTHAGLVHHVAANGHSYDEWLTHAAAARALEISTKSLRRYWQAGRIARYELGEGVMRYNPSELKLFKRTLQPGIDDIDDDSEDDGRGERFRPAYVEMLQVAVVQIKEQQSHNAELIKLITGPVNNTFEVLRQTIKEMTARALALEGKRDEMVVAREKMLSEDHERNLLTKMAEEDGQVRRKLFETFEKMAPRAMDHIVAGAVKADPTKTNKVVATLELLNTLDADKFEMLMKAGLLTQEQAELVLKIIKPDDLPDDAATVEEVEQELQGEGQDDDDQGDGGAAETATVETSGEPIETSGEPVETTSEPATGDDENKQETET